MLIFVKFQCIWFGEKCNDWHNIFTFARQWCCFGLIDVHHGTRNYASTFEMTILFFTIPIFHFQSEFDVVETVIRIIFVICALIWCSSFCYFGDMASNRLSSIGLAVYAANWYDYPVQLQRFIVLMISRSGKPAYFNAFDVINCSLEVFGKVVIQLAIAFQFIAACFKTLLCFIFFYLQLCKSACSYYVVFRSFSKI